MPIHRYSFEGPSERMISETIVFRGEISAEDYFGPFAGPGHTPSVELLVPPHPAGRHANRHVDYPAEAADFRSGEDAKRRYLDKIEDMLIEHFQQKKYGPFYVSVCHDGIYIFFGLDRERDAFLKALEGRFGLIEKASTENLQVARSRIGSGFKAASETLRQEYTRLAAHDRHMLAVGQLSQKGNGEPVDMAMPVRVRVPAAQHYTIGK